MKNIWTSMVILGLGAGMLGGCAGSRLPGFSGADESPDLGWQDKDGPTESFQTVSYQPTEMDAVNGVVVPGSVAQPITDPMIGASYQAAEVLVESSRIPVAKHRNLVIATFVNIDNLEESSALGRMMAEQIASRLTQLGYRVVELKLRNSIFIKNPDGEFVLSRDVRSVGSRHNAQAVVAGTYAVSSDRVYVNARLIDIANSTLTASHDYAVPMTRTAFGLITGCVKEGQWICRMP